MLRVGLTGGIGSGKSSVAALLAERGALVIDADVLAREVVAAHTTGLAEVVAAFGRGVLTGEGELDRPAMGRLVFDDAAARRRLEAIIHPRVRSRAAQLEADAPPGAVVVHEIPLLVETGQEDAFDVVLVVDAPMEQQVTRLLEDRALTEQEAEARIRAQATREQRLAVADEVVRNDGSLEQLRRAVDDVWHRLTGKAT